MWTRNCSLGRFKLTCFVLAFALRIGISGGAEPDRLIRTLLGVSSIPVRFPPPSDKKCCYLAIATFNDGQFLGYVQVFSPIENFHVDADRPNYEAELGWAEKNGKYGYFLTTPAGSQGFQADERFRGLGGIHFPAVERAPTQTLGPYSVLGYGFALRSKGPRQGTCGTSSEASSRWPSSSWPCSTRRKRPENSRSHLPSWIG